MEKHPSGQQRRQSVDCPVCKRPQTSKNLARHLRSHKWNPLEIQTFNAACFKKSNKGTQKVLEECSTCGIFVTRLRRHMKMHKKAVEQEIVPQIDEMDEGGLVNEEGDEVKKSEDLVKTMINDKLRAKYGEFGTYIKRQQFYKSPTDAEKLKKMLQYVKSYHTSSYSKGKEEDHPTVVQMEACLKLRIEKLCFLLGRLPGFRELLDPDLFREKELVTDTYAASSKIKLCSDFVSLAEAVLWNKRIFAGSEIGDFFADISNADIVSAQGDVRNAKSRFRHESMGKKVDLDLEKEERVVRKMEISKIWTKTKEIIQAEGGSDSNSFRKNRDHLITSLAAFHPVRLMPLKDMTLKCVLEPLKTNPDSVVLRVRGVRFGGRHKTYHVYGSPILTMKTELYDILLRYVDKLKTKFRIPLKPDHRQTLLCKWDGSPLDSVGNIITKVANDILGRHVSATDFRRAKTVHGRRAGFNKSELSKDMLHSKKTADNYYDINPTTNTISLQYFNLITSGEDREDEVQEQEDTTGSDYNSENEEGQIEDEFEDVGVHREECDDEDDDEKMDAEEEVDEKVESMDAEEAGDDDELPPLRVRLSKRAAKVLDIKRYRL